MKPYVFMENVIEKSMEGLPSECRRRHPTFSGPVSPEGGDAGEGGAAGVPSFDTFTGFLRPSGAKCQGRTRGFELLSRGIRKPARLLSPLAAREATGAPLIPDSSRHRRLVLGQKYRNFPWEGEIDKVKAR